MKKIPIVEMLYDPGREDREFIEDRSFCNLSSGIFAAIDGFSAPYSYQNPPLLFNGLSGGEMVSDIVVSTLAWATPNSILKKLVIKTNEAIKTEQANYGIRLDDAGSLAGASAVIGKIGNNQIEIIQAGDCYAVWAFNDGQIAFTKNKIYETDLQARENFAYLMKKHQNNRLKAWIEHCPFLADLKRKTVNKEQRAILNGQLEAASCWQELNTPLQGLELLIVFTDGFIAAEQMADEKIMAKDVIDLYKARGGAGAETGLKRILAATRAIQRMNIQTSHEPYPEATAMAISFE